MKEIKNVLICGLGAIGSIYADKFQHTSNLKILVDKNRLMKYKNNPITFNNKFLNLDYILPENNSFKADLIVIATKNDGLAEAVENIKNFVYEDTIILSLLNGITSENIIASKYGIDKVLHSFYIGGSAMRTGRSIVHYGDATINIGSPYSQNLSKIEIVKNFFDKSNITYKIPNDIIYAMWSKFMLNVASNQVSAITKMTFGQMCNNSRCIELLVNIMEEVKLIAKAEGIKNTDSMVNEVLSHIRSISPEGKTSMLQDIEAHRKTEVEDFAGTVIKLGKKHNLPTPYNSTLKQLIEVIQTAAE